MTDDIMIMVDNIKYSGAADVDTTEEAGEEFCARGRGPDSFKWLHYNDS